MSDLERTTRINHGNQRLHDGLTAKPTMKPKPKPLQASDDSLMSLLLVKPRDIIIEKILSPTIRHFSFDGTGSLPIPRRTNPHRTQSTESLSSEESVDLGWAKSALLNLSDSVRASLNHDKCLGPEADELSNFLATTLNDEDRRVRPLDIDTLEYARLDKLLNDVTHHFAEQRNLAKLAHEFSLKSRIDAKNAKKLRTAWERRFKANYFKFDERRLKGLVGHGGPLKDISFENGISYDLGYWQSRNSVPISDTESSLQFEAGHWWLNLACAHRDGIVASCLEIPTKGCYGITALPLLTGTEELIRNDEVNVVKYIRKGRAGDMHIPLISQVGDRIRILRGYRLKSIYSPQAGVRYDGLYILRQYGSKLDIMTDTYTLELTLERVAEQRPLALLKRVPKPSQLDDWDLYEKLEGNHIRDTQGKTVYSDWCIQRESEKVDREDWKRDREFRASVSWKVKTAWNGWR